MPYTVFIITRCDQDPHDLPMKMKQWYSVNENMELLFHDFKYFQLKDGTSAPTAAIKDIDFFADKELCTACKEWWEENIAVRMVNRCNKPYFKKIFGNMENYVRAKAPFWPLIVATPDGQWHMSKSFSVKDIDIWDTQFYDRFIAPYDPENTCITCIECFEHGAWSNE